MRAFFRVGTKLCSTSALQDRRNATPGLETLDSTLDFDHGIDYVTRLTEKFHVFLKKKMRLPPSASVISTRISSSRSKKNGSTADICLNGNLDTKKWGVHWACTADWHLRDIPSIQCRLWTGFQSDELYQDKFTQPTSDHTLGSADENPVCTSRGPHTFGQGLQPLERGQGQTGEVLR